MDIQLFVNLSYYDVYACNEPVRRWTKYKVKKAEEICFLYS